MGLPEAALTRSAMDKLAECQHRGRMPDPAQFALFLATALVLAVMPGPGIFYVAVRTLAGGRAEGVASSLGTGLGGMVHVAGGAMGVSALVLASAELFTLLKIAGALYLAWLGLRTILAARRDAAQFAVFGLVSVALNTAADLVVAYAAGAIRGGLAARPRLLQRLREASGAALVALGAGLLLTRRPAA